MPEIVERAVRDLIPYARNPRKNDAVVDQMAASIREFGFKVPILALSDGTIVDGHLRLKAAQKLKIETVHVILCDEWTPGAGEGVPFDGQQVGGLGGMGHGTAPF